MRPLAALAILAGTTPAWGQSAPPADSGQVLAEVRARPDESRSEFERQLSLAAAGADDTRREHLDRAGALARAYAVVWHDSVPLRTVVRFSEWPVERRIERMLADSIRRQGNSALGSDGFPTALSLWRESLRHATASGDSAAIAAALVNIGSGYYRVGELDSASVWLRRGQQVAMATRDYRAAATALGTLGSVAKDRGDLESSIRLYGEAGRLRERVGDSRGLAADDNNLGLVAQALGDTAGARKAFERALANNRRFGRLEPAAANLTNLANLASLQAGYLRAGRLYREALTIYRDAGNHTRIAEVQHELGRLEVRRGDYGRAVEFLAHAGRGFEETGAGRSAMLVAFDLSEAYAAMGRLQDAVAALRSAERVGGAEGVSDGDRGSLALARADLATRFNNVPEALRQYGRAERLFQSVGDARRLADAREGRGFALLRDEDYPAADRALVSAARAYEAAGDPRGRALAQLLRGFAAAAQRDTAAARRAYLDAAAGLDRAHDVVDRGLALGALGELLAGQGLALAADSLYAEALGLTDGHPSPAVSWWLHAGRGRVLRSLGQPDRAAAELRRAVADLETSAGTLRLAERRAAFMEDKWDVYGDLALLERERGNTAAAFAASERLRARQMLALLSAGRVEEPLAAQRSAEAQELRRAIVELSSRLEGGDAGDELRDSRPASPAVPALREALSATESRYAELLLQLRESQPEYAAVAAADVAPLASIASRLAPDEALIEYLVTDSAALAFVITSDGARTVDLGLGRRALAQRIGFARATLDPGSAASTRALWRTPLRRLYRDLFAPVEETGALDGKHRLTIVPHAELHYLPFAALLEPGASDRFLVERYQLSYAPSASVWARLGRSAPMVRPLEVLALAPRATALPGSRVEVEAVRRAFGERAEVLEGARASEPLLRAASSRYGILHLATHGVLNKRNPLFSYLALSPSDSDDGRLEVREVFGLALRSQLVVLSACETALGAGAHTDVPAGDDWVGLVQAFLVAGAGQVIATAWPIDDRSTAGFMAAFYQRLAEGVSASEALAQVQRETLRAPATKNPSYWAGFVLSGGPQ